VGEPGAEKILLFAGRQALLAPESNGLRVLVRLGLVREEKSYAKTYAASREAAKGLKRSRAGCRRPTCSSSSMARRCANAMPRAVRPVL
jgi:hypothetical protein